MTKTRTKCIFDAFQWFFVLVQKTKITFQLGFQDQCWKSTVDLIYRWKWVMRENVFFLLFLLPSEVPSRNLSKSQSWSVDGGGTIVSVIFKMKQKTTETILIKQTNSFFFIEREIDNKVCVWRSSFFHIVSIGLEVEK